MSPFSLLKHSITSRVCATDFFDFDDMRRIKWRLALKANRSSTAKAIPRRQYDAETPGAILHRGQVVFKIDSSTA